MTAEGPPGGHRDTETVIVVHQGDGQWRVVVHGTTTTYETRTEALRGARDLARRHAPSSITFGDQDDSRDDSREKERTASRAPLPTFEAPTKHTGRHHVAISRGPAVLGRSLVIAEGHDIADGFGDVDVLVLDDSAFDDPATLAAVRHRYLARIATVYRLAHDIREPAPHPQAREPYLLGVEYSNIRDDIWSLLLANAFDARDPASVHFEPIALALELGATRVASNGDVCTQSGALLWCDGGPLALFDPIDGTGVVPAATLRRGAFTPTRRAQGVGDLAPDQLSAIEEPSVRSRIIAPAGSGKTTVLTERARHLIRCGIPAAAITMVAFNKRAQLELVARTTDLAGLTISTFNALALSVIDHGSNSRTATLDEHAVRKLIGELVSFPRRANTDPIAAWIDALSAVRLGLVEPAVVEANALGEVDGFADFFARYREVLLARGAVDFDEQIYRAIERLVAEPALRAHLAATTSVLLVDEFQDLTPAHLLLLRLMGGPALPITAVGDDDQTIYGYAGASPNWLINFSAFVPDSASHELTINYRCPPAVVAGATNLLSHNRRRVHKATTPRPGVPMDPRRLVVSRVSDPTHAAVDTINGWLASGVDPGEIAVLSRVNALLAPIQAALVGESVPFVQRDGLGFLSRAGVEATLSWLELSLRPGNLDPVHLARAVRRPNRGISPRVASWVCEQRTIEGIYRLARRITDERSANHVLGFAADLEATAAIASTSDTEEIVRAISSAIGLDTSLATLDLAHRGRNSTAHADDLRALRALARQHRDPSTFSAWLAAVLAAPSPTPATGVTLGTIHRVKGLEWPYVIVFDASGGIMPHQLSTDIEEERRVFHVAITRAKHELVVIAAKDEPSFFLDELVEPARTTPPTGDDAPRARAATTRHAPVVPASIGLQFRWGGYEAIVHAITQAGVIVAIGTSKVAVAFDSDIFVNGATATLGTPRSRPQRHAVELGDVDTQRFELLRAWRLERSRADRVPAYMVLSDKTLTAIAVAQPSTPRELLAVDGIGPTKVERYGAELLEVLGSI